LADEWQKYKFVDREQEEWTLGMQERACLQPVTTSVIQQSGAHLTGTATHSSMGLLKISVRKLVNGRRLTSSRVGVYHT
jgi:hypothetical protein